MSKGDSFLPSGGALRGGLWHEMSSEMDRRGVLPAGARVGPYAVEKEIGRGGMGAVYLAQRVDGQFDQQVAVKVLKPGMESDEVARRFGRERQILASLQHPSIARLYDGGVTDDGRPYFVMEHVDGVPIDVHCRERQLSVEERLALFVKVDVFYTCATQDSFQAQVNGLKPEDVRANPDILPTYPSDVTVRGTIAR